MRKFVRLSILFVLVLAVSSVVHSPTLVAQPEFFVCTVYYDASLNEIGVHQFNCDQPPAESWGVTTGAGGAKWKETTTIRCEGMEYISWEGSEYCGPYEVWTQVGTLGGPSSC